MWWILALCVIVSLLIAIHKIPQDVRILSKEELSKNIDMEVTRNDKG